jgi:hypothetical protein
MDDGAERFGSSCCRQAAVHGRCGIVLHSNCTSLKKVLMGRIAVVLVQPTLPWAL